MEKLYEISYERTAPPYSVTEVLHDPEDVIDRLARISKLDVLAYDVEVIRREVDDRGHPAVKAMQRAFALGSPVKWEGAAREEDTTPPAR